MKRSINLLRSLSLAILFAAMMSLTALPTAQADSITSVGNGSQNLILGTASYELTIGTDQGLVTDPSNPVARLVATRKSNNELVVARNTPILRLTNTSPDALDITRLTIDINDSSTVFDALAIIESPSGLAPILVSPLDTVHHGDKTSILEFSFENNPIAPGESFMFQVDLDPAAGFPNGNPDYRNVFWNQFGSSRDDNALVSVTYDVGELPAVAFFEYSFADQLFDSLDADGTMGTSTIITGATQNVGVYQFAQAVEVVEQTVVIPEPGSVVLFILGAALLLNFYIRRRNASKLS